MIIADRNISASTKTTTFGRILDNELKIKDYESLVIKSCHVHLKSIGSIRHLIHEDISKMLMSTLVLGRVDDSSALLVGCSHSTSYIPQKVLHKAAWIAARNQISISYLF